MDKCEPTETLTSEDKQTLQERNDTPINKGSPPLSRSIRWRICLYLFIAYVLLYAHRVNLSLAIVCMVNTQTREVTHTTNFSQLTPLLDDTSNTSYSEIEYSKLINKSRDTNDFLESLEVDNACGGNTAETKMDWEPELHWDKTHISFLLSSYFYGSFFTQIPAGTLADRFGGKHIVTAVMLVSAVCSLLTPVCARVDITWVFVLRILIGLAGGALIPAGTSIITVWAPPQEIPSMFTITGTGCMIGAVLTFISSGFLCTYGFDNGWPSIFYIHGAITAVFACVWMIDGYSRPKHHPRISTIELQYINRNRNHTTNRRRSAPPWRSILTSKPLWATFIAHFCFNWCFMTILINIPLFLRDVLHFDVKSNGLYSALPLVVQMVSSLTLSKLASIVIRKRLLRHLYTRRLYNTLCLLGTGVCMVGTGYITCDIRHMAVVLLCICCLFGGLAYGGFLVTHPEFAGQYSGTAFGITNAGGVISSLLASMFAGLLTPNGLQEEWQKVFYIAAVLNVFGTLMFLFFSEVHLQPWAYPTVTKDIQANKINEKQDEFTDNNDGRNEEDIPMNEKNTKEEENL